jgi:CDP-diacylglycerol--serine O-phosphatidyltransferase
MNTKADSRKDKLKKGIYILPNIFTSLNIFFGFYAAISAIDGKFNTAALAILIATVFDIMDGKIARATHTTSRFGIEYDSLADLISFGMAPALMMYLWALEPFGRVGWLAGFLYMACGALRLARFNTQVGTISSDYFVGLPIPAAASMNAVTVLISHKIGVVKGNGILILLMLYVLSFLMVSKIPYQSFKKPEVFKRMKFNYLVVILLALIFIAAQPAIAIFFLGLIYVISGPALYLKKFQEIRTQKTGEQTPGDSEGEEDDELDDF